MALHLMCKAIYYFTFFMLRLQNVNHFLIFILTFSICSCTSTGEKKRHKNYVKVVAHRGDWRNAPENSLQGAQNCIEWGVDMVEVDLAMTKDSILVLMHDETIDRTTNGKGFIQDWTFDSLRNLRLKLRDGTLTQERVPTFEELMRLSKGKTEIFVDKGYQYIERAYKILEKTGTLGEAHFLGFVSGDQYRHDYPKLHYLVNYIPLVLPSDTIAQLFKSYKQIEPSYYLYSFQEEDSLQLATVKDVTTNAYAIATTQLARYCAGHTDSLSLTNPEEGWGWAVGKGFNAICTDFPEHLIHYLKSNDLR
jgi:glycerophosphoryl diester phosphodiesterase